VKFALIEAEKATCPVETACKALGVSRPGFYAWPSLPTCPSAQQHRLTWRFPVDRGGGVRSLDRSDCRGGVAVLHHPPGRHERGEVA
jgi:hypothetical protein